MIGKIYPTRCAFFDPQTRTQKIKSRPVLVIGNPIDLDAQYTVLPVSTIVNRQYYNKDYDIELKVQDFPKLKLTRNSYVRTHKQITAYRAEIDMNRCIGDLKNDYPLIFEEVLKRLDDYNQSLQINAKI